MISTSGAISLLAVTATVYPCFAFQSGRQAYLGSGRLQTAVTPLRASEDATVQCTTKPTLDPDIASQFTIQVCTSTNCSRKLNEVGLDKYNALGELYAQAQAVNMEKCVIIEDGGCQGGKNCKMGPCVAVLHEDYDGSVGLEGMNGNEMRERVFHNVMDSDDAGRVWSCMEKAITQMAEETDE